MEITAMHSAHKPLLGQGKPTRSPAPAASAASRQQPLLLLACLATASPVMAADGAVDARVQERANAVVSLMTFNVIPDITSSNLDISGGSGQQAALTMSQVGGGATMSKEVPIYLEGNLGYSRYDPKFVISQGEESRTIPAKWNSLTATGGIGWDFAVAPNWVLRPIANFSLGTVASDIQIGNWYLDRKTGKSLDFLDNGQLNVFGLGGSLMLDYELFSDTQDIDAEFRYSYLHLQSTIGTSPSVKGEANAENFGIYLRRRAPLLDWTLLDRPLRYVLEGARTEYLGDQRGLLGFNALNSVGVGLELDSSKYPVWVTRTRLMYRLMFGNNTNGYAIGLAMSF
jgi:hypothetical protein